MKDAGSIAIIISSVTPQPTSAGEFLLYRHLSCITDFDTNIVPHPYQVDNINIFNKCIKHLQKSRFVKLGNSLDVVTHGRSWNKTIEDSLELNSIKLKRPIILTVAHGDGCWAALRFATSYNLPLVTFFHDWWPDIPILYRSFQSLLNQRFIRLYQKSDLAFCVSPQMQQCLGEHKNSHVLYPIPAHLAKRPLDLSNDQTKFKMVYFGNLYEYGSMLGKLLEVSKDNSEICVQIRGSNPNWPADFRSEMRDRQLWLDFAPRDELNEWLASADAFLVVMSFEPALRRRMETSFPSKLPEYAQFGKPLVIWGPEYCSAIKWGLNDDKALCVTDSSAQAVIAALENLQRNPQRIKHYASHSQRVAAQEFNPHILQNQFMMAINQLNGKK